MRGGSWAPSHAGRVEGARKEGGERESYRCGDRQALVRRDRSRRGSARPRSKLCARGRALSPRGWCARRETSGTVEVQLGTRDHGGGRDGGLAGAGRELVSSISCTNIKTDPVPGLSTPAATPFLVLNSAPRSVAHRGD